MNSGEGGRRRSTKENLVRTPSLKEETQGAYSYRTHQALPLLQRVHQVATGSSPIEYVKVFYPVANEEKMNETCEARRHARPKCVHRGRFRPIACYGSMEALPNATKMKVVRLEKATHDIEAAIQRVHVTRSSFCT